MSIGPRSCTCKIVSPEITPCPVHGELGEEFWDNRASHARAMGRRQLAQELVDEIAKRGGVTNLRALLVGLGELTDPPAGPPVKFAVTPVDVATKAEQQIAKHHERHPRPGGAD